MQLVEIGLATFDDFARGNGHCQWIVYLEMVDWVGIIG